MLQVEGRVVVMLATFSRITSGAVGITTSVEEIVMGAVIYVSILKVVIIVPVQKRKGFHLSAVIQALVAVPATRVRH